MTAAAMEDPGRDLVVALQALDLQFSSVKDPQGKRYWHVPFADSILTFYMGGSATTVGITSVLNGQGNNENLPPSNQLIVYGLGAPQLATLLEANSALGMAKVSLANGVISVSAELPIVAISPRSVEVSIAHVLHGVQYVRRLLTAAP